MDKEQQPISEVLGKVDVSSYIERLKQTIEKLQPTKKELKDNEITEIIIASQKLVVEFWGTDGLGKEQLIDIFVDCPTIDNMRIWLSEIEEILEDGNNE